jgi:hypothetical protein
MGANIQVYSPLIQHLGGLQPITDIKPKAIIQKNLAIFNGKTKIEEVDETKLSHSPVSAKPWNFTY